MARALYMLGLVANARGNYPVARTLIEEGLVLFKESRDTWSTAYALADLASPMRIQGEYSSARSLAEEAFALFSRLNDKRGIAYALRRLAHIYFSEGELEKVHSLVEEGLVLFREVGNKEEISSSLSLLGWVTLEKGDSARAKSLAEESLAIFREIGVKRGVVTSLNLLASVVRSQGDYEQAFALTQESLAIAGETNSKSLLIPCMEGLGEVVVAKGEGIWAARLWGAAEVLRETIGIPWSSFERAVYERFAFTARLQLGEQIFAAAWAEGRTMTPEQALASQKPSSISREMSTVMPSIPPLTPLPSYPAGLTAREVEVLRLVAQGLSNAQIAEQLIISPYTVNAHMRSIYSKLEVSSRIAVMQFAARHHLM